MGKHRWPTAGDTEAPRLPLAPTRSGRPGGGASLRHHERDHVEDEEGPGDRGDPDAGWDTEADEQVFQPGVRWGVARSAALVLLGVALAIGAALFLVRSSEPSAAAVSVHLEAEPPVADRPAATPGGAGGHPDEPPVDSSTGAAGPAAPQDVVVYITGAVSSPGVVSVAAGTRLFEIIEQAGGALPEADLAGINLAGIPSDGQHIHLFALGEEPRADAGVQTGTAPPFAGAREGPPGAAGGIDINAATLAEIETLPRVGPVLGQRIIDWREEHGPFVQPADIDAVPGIGPALLEGILPLIVAG